MMGYFRFLMLGVFFGILLTKAQVISWYRIFEMFHFDSFHMYGIIGSAVILGAIGVSLIKRYRLKSIKGKVIAIAPQKMGITRYLVGGTVFGMGWAMTGACPGPIYILIGNGFTVFLVVLLSAAMGTLAYGMVRNKLPH